MPASAVQLWIASPADFAEADWQKFDALLDSTERARADSFRLEADRKSYILAHALRRIALGEELNVIPSTLLFSSEPAGKPLLLYPFCKQLGFSHSHTRGAVVFALSRDGQLGVDIEAHHPARGDFGLLAQFLTLPEPPHAPFNGAALSEQEFTEQFFLYWTALEAFWKAAGTGFSAANPRVRLERRPLGLWHVGLPNWAATAVAPWVIPVAAPSGFSISLAVQSPDVRVFTRRITGCTLKGYGLSDRTHFSPRIGRTRSGILALADSV